MRSHANHHGPFAILSALGSAAVLALAFVTQVGAKESAIPFSGSFSGTVAFTSPTTAAFEGSGLATLTGRTVNSGITTVLGPPDAAGCIPNLNIETLTSANGDELTIASHDLGCPIAETTIHGTGNWVVVGGTGRFAGATGSGTLDGVSAFGPNFSPGTFNVTVNGTLLLN